MADFKILIVYRFIPTTNCIQFSMKNWQNVGKIWFGFCNLCLWLVTKLQGPTQFLKTVIKTRNFNTMLKTLSRNVSMTGFYSLLTLTPWPRCCVQLVFLVFDIGSLVLRPLESCRQNIFEPWYFLYILPARKSWNVALNILTF